ncbi:MAG: hypothetical protein ACFFBL_01220 [Promethearchaeota archaeon]
MPFTPYHFGPAVLVGILLFPFIDFTTVIVASVVLDLEPLAVILFNLPIPLHSFFHTYLGATIVAVVLSICIYPFRNHLNAFVSLFGLEQDSAFRHILAASLIGTYSHVFLDSFLYSEMNPLFPFLGNPFVGALASESVYNLCLILGFVGFFVYMVRVLLNLRVNRIEGDAFD